MTGEIGIKLKQRWSAVAHNSNRFSKSQKKKLNQIYASDQKWKQKHWDSIFHNYSKAPFFKEVEKLLEPHYLVESEKKTLAEFTISLTTTILQYLEINTTITRASLIETSQDSTEKTLDICLKLKGQHYVTRPKGKELSK